MANRNIERAVRVALLASAVSAGAYSAGAFAQEAGATPDEVEQIIVTGSRIPQPNLEGTSPVTVVGAQQVQLEGVTDTANLVNNLPQAFAAQGGNVANGSSGTSTLNLRNLGSTRTLVLVNGRRMPAGDPASISGISPDINMIPAPLIERVEVLTGGAGAVYGSDAVAGVVNFIMKDDFEGVELDGQYSFYNHDNGSGDEASAMKKRINNRGFDMPPGTATDGDAYELSILMGSNFADGKGNATMYIGYRHTEPVMQADRIYSACALQTNASGATTGGGTSPSSYLNGARCGGSGTNATGSFYNANLYPLNPLPGQDQIPLFDGAYGVAAGPGGVGVPGASPLYNYAPLNYYQRPDERWSADVFMHYDVSDQVQAYGEFMFMDDHTVAQIAPSGVFSGYVDVPCDGSNPLVSSAWLDTLCASYNQIPIDPAGDLTDPSNYTVDYANPQYVTPFGHTFRQRRNVEGGPRQDDLRHTDYRGVLGIRGKIFDHWNYDLFGQYGTTILNEHVNNYVSNVRALYALDAVANPDYDPTADFNAITNNPAMCAGASSYAPGCVPWDIWNPGGVNAAALDYINVQGFSSGSTTQTIVNGTLSADLGDYGWRMPWAASGIGVAFGAEYRQEGLQLDYDVENTTGDLGGGSGVLLPTKGSYNVTDLYMEARVPIVEDAPGAKSLVFNGSYRYSDYSTGVNTNTYGLGLDWAPMDDFKVRGSFQHAVRAPNILELFTPQAVGLYDWNADPCGQGATASLADCLYTGITASQYNNVVQSPAGQYNALFGGQDTLKPETADTWTVGLVLTPTFLEGFTMTIDYFNIEVTDVINSINPATTVSNCIKYHDPYFCDNIHRDPAGSLWLSKTGFVTALTTNLGYYKTSGTDFNVTYNLGLGDWGSLNFNELATWLDKFEVQEIPRYPSYECKGLYGPSCGTPLPEWKSKFQTVWSTPWNVDLALTWRYIDGVELDQYHSDVCGDGCAPKPFDKNLSSQNYIDLAATYTFAEHYTLNAGINNLFDESPPISSSVGTGYGNGNTYPNVYDALGRYLFVGLSAKF